MNYMYRNGVTEQVMYFRTQPEHLKHAPFEDEDEWVSKAKLDMAVFIVCAIGLAGLFIWVYTQ